MKRILIVVAGMRLGALKKRRAYALAAVSGQDANAKLGGIVLGVERQMRDAGELQVVIEYAEHRIVIEVDFVYVGIQRFLAQRAAKAQSHIFGWKSEEVPA